MLVSERYSGSALLLIHSYDGRIRFPILCRTRHRLRGATLISALSRPPPLIRILRALFHTSRIVCSCVYLLHISMCLLLLLFFVLLVLLLSALCRRGVRNLLFLLRYISGAVAASITLLWRLFSRRFWALSATLPTFCRSF